MTKYKINVYAQLEFEIEAEDDYSANNEATCYMEEHKEDLDWYFDSIQNTETKKYI